MWVSGDVIPWEDSEFLRRLKLKLSKLIQPSRVHYEALQKSLHCLGSTKPLGACPQRVFGSYTVR